MTTGHSENIIFDGTLLGKLRSDITDMCYVAFHIDTGCSGDMVVRAVPKLYLRAPLKSHSILIRWWHVGKRIHLADLFASMPKQAESIDSD